MQLDEMWSFVDSKGNKQWIWLALDADSLKRVGVFVGDRSRQAAQRLWQSLPAVYRQCAICYTDFWEAYEQVLPSKRHRAVGKQTGKTSLTHAVQQHSTTKSGAIRFAKPYRSLKS